MIDFNDTPERECFIARLADVGPCTGPLDRAHLIPQRVLRHELGIRSVRCPTCGVQYAPCVGPRGGERSEYHVSRGYAWKAIVWDPRAWSWCCTGHHLRFDQAHQIPAAHAWIGRPYVLRLSRDELPATVESYAAQHGLGWWLDLSYGSHAAVRLAA